MNHQPFESWITAEEPLDPDQAQSLRAHLQDCEDCRKLAAGWAASGAYLAARPSAGPAPGFTQRFQASLAERRYHQQQLQIRRTFLFLLTGSVVSLLAFFAHLLFVVTPGGVFVTVIRYLTTFLVWWNHLQETYLPLVQSLPVYVPIAMWIVFATTLVVLSFIWVLSIWRISTQGVPINENHQ